MKVRLLSLNIDRNMPFAKFQARVVSSIKNYAEGNETFEHYSKMRDFFDGFQDALENDELIIIAVDKNHYFKLKTAISQAFEVENTYNSTILNMLENNDSISEEQRKGFSSFPEPATVFLSKDGMYSGFGFDNGEKFIVVLPIDNDRINLILRNGVVPYLASGIGEGEDNFLSEVQHYDNERVETAVSRLLESGSVVAVNGTQNAEVIKSCGDMVEHFDEVFIFTPYVEDKGEVNATEYAAQLARVSLDLSAANIGASISEIYETEESKYICIAVADDESATVRKLYLEEGESEASFIESAATELIELVGEKAAGIRSIGIEISDAVSEEPNEMEKKPSKKANTIIAIVLGIVFVLCAVLAIVVKVQGEDGSATRMLRKVFGYETTEPTTESTTAPEPTTNKEPQKEEIKVKISDMIMADLVEIENKRAQEAEKLTEESTSSEPVTNEAGETVSNNTEEPNTEIETDKGAPEFITVNGEKMAAKTAIAGLVMSEMGEGYNTEAVKAQAIVIYTYLKYRDNGFVIDGVEIEKAINDEVEKAVDSVYGRYITYGGEVALTPYFEAAAGATADASTIFEGSYPYLKSVARLDGNPDAAAPGYETTVKLKRGEIQGILLDLGYEIDVNDDPIKWISIKKHDTAVSYAIGYVTSVKIGNKEVSGYEFVSTANEIGLKSNCFKFEYDSSTETFTFTSYGIGYGVGMSKAGANALAEKGYSYERILKAYYVGTTIQKEKA